MFTLVTADFDDNIVETSTGVSKVHVVTRAKLARTEEQDKENTRHYDDLPERRVYASNKRDFHGKHIAIQN